MNVLAYNAYYSPENASSMYLTENIYEELAKSGCNITLYVPSPCRGVTNEVRETYKKRKNEKQHNGKLSIHRISMYREGTKTISRAIRYLLLNAAFIWKGLKTDADVIFVQSTPPTQGAMAAIIKKIKKVPIVYNVQDVFPDSLITTNITQKGSIIWKIGRVIENFSYKNADKIIVISDSFKKNLLDKGVPDSKIMVVPNWIDCNEVVPIRREENSLFKELGVSSESFIVVYAGNFGAAQGAMVVLEAAKYLKDSKDIHFAIFGGGSEFDKAKQFVIDNKLDNVTIDDLKPPERVSEVYSLGDIALITCKPGVGMSGMPSKTWSIMACNTPIIAAFDVDSELSAILKEANAGICVKPGDGKLLSEEILFAKKNMGCYSKDARSFVIANASREKCVAKYRNSIFEACKLK